MVQSILVAPGTGKQGKAVAQEFLQHNVDVNLLLRNESSEGALSLQAAGAKLHKGDLGDIYSIARALEGIDTVFFAILADSLMEVPFATNIISAAQQAGVKQVIYTSVARTGEHESFPNWSDDYPLAWYWKSKHDVENLLRAAKFESLTILRPAFFMQNFCRPEVDFLFPELVESKTLTVPFDADTKFDLIDSQDIARFALAAAKDPAGFAGKEIGLAGEKLTPSELASALHDISGYDIIVDLVDKKTSYARAAKGDLRMSAMEFQREVGYGVSLKEANSHGVALTTIRKAVKKESLGW